MLTSISKLSKHIHVSLTSIGTIILPLYFSLSLNPNRIHVGNIYLHLPASNPYMEHLEMFISIHFLCKDLVHAPSYRWMFRGDIGDYTTTLLCFLGLS